MGPSEVAQRLLLEPGMKHKDGPEHDTPVATAVDVLVPVAADGSRSEISLAAEACGVEHLVRP